MDNENGAFAAQLRALIQTIDVAHTLTAPLESSIKHLLSVAAASFGCDEASVLVREGDDGSLRFMCAIGEVAGELMKITIPPGRGIAGFVFQSGQPMAVADAARESAFYADIDRLTGYTTQTVLATPLRADAQIVGVLEFVNRIGAPPYRPFSPDEMDRAAHFATAIAPLVEAFERAGLVEQLFHRLMEQARTGGEGATDGGELLAWMDELHAAPEHRDMLKLAVMLRDIAVRGEAERELCREMLKALDRFIRGASSELSYSVTP